MTLFTDKAIKYVPQLMNDLNISHVNACGIFGNLGTETGGFTALQEKRPTVANSKGGYGWMQWTGMKAPNGRRYKFETWAKTNGLNVNDDNTNYKYLIKESLNEEYNSINLLRKCTTIESSTETFMLKNLRPGIPNLNNRINWANKAYEATKGTQSIISTSSTAIGGTPNKVPHDNNVPNVSKNTIDTNSINKPKVLVSPEEPRSGDEGYSKHLKTQGGLIATGGTIAAITPYHYLPYILGATAIIMVASYILIKYIQWRHGQTN